MKRRLALALAALTSLVPAIALGLGLGDIRLHSALNQQLDAEIELISATDSEIDALRVHLAGADLFDRYGIESIDALQTLKFTVVRRDDKSAYVRITSDVAIREPFMTFLVEAQWPRGRLLREYTLLLDPPVLAAPPQTYTETAPFVAEPAPASVTTGVETAAVAAAVAPTTASQPETAIAAEPSPEPVIATPIAPEPTAEAAVADNAAAEPTAAAYEAGTYGPVKRNEALWTIAKNIKPDEATTINQMMIALYRANPEAFRNNINVLKRGAILRIPDIAELRAISASEATAEAVRHHQEWEATRVAVAPSTAPSDAAAPIEAPAPSAVPSMEPTPVAPTPQPEPVAPVVSAPMPSTAPDTSSALSIVAPTDDAGAVSTDPAARVADLEKQLAEAKTAGTNTKRKRDRIARLETELEQARAAIVVQSDTLSQIQGPATIPSMSPATTPSLAAMPATVAPAPATVAAEPATPAKPEKGLLDGILDNLFDPLVLGLLVGIPLLVALGIVGLKQYKAKAATRKAQSDLSAWATEPSSDEDKTVVGGDEPTLQASPRGGGSEERTVIRGPDPALLAATGETVAIPEDQVEKTVMLPRDELDKTIMQTMIVDSTPAEPEPAVSHDTVVGGTPLKLDENDPMSEADFHMAYGLYDQAADLIKKAAQREPARRDLKLKLLEIYFSAGSKAAFVAEAKALRQSMGASPDADWQNIAIFGKQIAPEEGIFNESVSTAGQTIDFDASMGGGTTPASPIDLAFDEPSAAPAAATPAAAPAPKADEGLEFDLGDFKLDDVGTSSATPAAVAAPAQSEHTDSQSDFDKALAELSSFVETNVPKEVAGGTAAAAAGEVDLGSLELDDAALSVDDGTESGSEIDTKLDLARAYIDMGDPGSAKGILEEVVADGDDKQKSEAQKLLKQLG